MPRVSGTYRRAEAIYAKMEESLLPEHQGEVIAIEPLSGDYIVGTDEVEVALEGRRRHPGKKFGLFRIGRPVVHKLRVARAQGGKVTRNRSSSRLR